MALFITCHSKLVCVFIMLTGFYKWDVMESPAHIYNLQNVVLYCICKCMVLQLLAMQVFFSTFFVQYTRSTTRVLRVYESVLGKIRLPMLYFQCPCRPTVQLPGTKVRTRYCKATYCDYTDHFQFVSYSKCWLNILKSPLCIHSKNVRILSARKYVDGLC